MRSKNKPKEEQNWTQGFVLEFIDSQGTQVILEVSSSGWAEQMLRGLVHSGFKVSVREQPILVTGWSFEESVYPVANEAPCDPAPYHAGTRSASARG